MIQKTHLLRSVLFILSPILGCNTAYQGTGVAQWTSVEVSEEIKINGASTETETYSHVYTSVFSIDNDFKVKPVKKPEESRLYVLFNGQVLSDALGGAAVQKASLRYSLSSLREKLIKSDGGLLNLEGVDLHEGDQLFIEYEVTLFYQVNGQEKQVEKTVKGELPMTVAFLKRSNKPDVEHRAFCSDNLISKEQGSGPFIGLSGTTEIIFLDHNENEVRFDLGLTTNLSLIQIMDDGMDFGC